MRRILRTLAVLTLLGCGIYGAWKAHTPKPHIKIPTTRYHGYEINRGAINQARAFTVLISVEGFGGVGRGTGVLIDATHVLTCAHMTESPTDDMWIFPYPVGLVVKGKPIFLNRREDLAILELSRPVIIPHYATFMDMYYDGEPITIIGNTLGAMKWFVTFGIISGDFDGFLLTDGTLFGGNSGGPWINEKGEVVALTSWTLLRHGEESGIHGGVSAKTIRAFLKEWNSPSLGQILQMMIGGGE